MICTRNLKARTYWTFLKRGLNEDYAKQILTCESLEAATRVIREYDRFRAERQSDPKPNVSFAETIPHLTGQTPLSLPKGPLTRKDDLPATSTPRPATIDRRYAQRQQNCFVCNQTGHYANECPNRQQINRPAVTQNQGTGPNPPPPQRPYVLRQRQHIDYNENRRNKPQQPVSFVRELIGQTPDLRPGWMQGPPSSPYQGPPEDPAHDDNDPRRCATVFEVEEELVTDNVWDNGEQEDSPHSDASSLTFFSCNRTTPAPINKSPQIELGELPIVILRVGAYKVKALMDSGAVLTAISSQLASLISQRWYAWEGAALKLADGKQATPMGVITVELELDRKVTRMPVAIFQNMGIDVILGTNFMSAMDIVLMAGRRKWFFFEDLEVKYDMNLGLEKSVGPYLVERRQVADRGIKRPTETHLRGRIRRSNSSIERQFMAHHLRPLRRLLTKTR